MRTRHHVKYYADSSRLHKNYKRSTENVQRQTGIPPSKKENKKIWRLRLALAPFRSKLAPYCHVFPITSYHLRTTIKTKWKLNSHYQLIVSCRLWRRFLCRQNYIRYLRKKCDDHAAVVEKIVILTKIIEYGGNYFTILFSQNLTVRKSPIKLGFPTKKKHDS